MVRSRLTRPFAPSEMPSHALSEGNSQRTGVPSRLYLFGSEGLDAQSLCAPAEPAASPVPEEAVWTVGSTARPLRRREVEARVDNLVEEYVKLLAVEGRETAE